MRRQEKGVLGGVGDLGVDDGSGRHVSHSAETGSRGFREESGLVTLLRDDERDAYNNNKHGVSHLK